MSEQAKNPESNKAKPEIKPVNPAAAQTGQRRAITHPRDVAAVVMAQINQVNAKKDELTAAMKALSDMTQQLATAYGKQMLAIEQLSRRLNALEGKAAADDKKKNAA